MYLFDISYSPRLVGVCFLILCGWCVVGLGPEGLGLMAFSLAPVGFRRFYFTIASAARSLCTQMTNKTKKINKKSKKGKKETCHLWHEPSRLQTRRLKSQLHQISLSSSTTPALSVSCTPTLPPYFPYHVLGA